jgi:outer membrane protein assembly factor BamB
VGTDDGLLHRFTPPAGGTGTWVEAWGAPADLHSPITGVLASDPSVDGVAIYAITAGPQLYALDPQGQTVWTTATEPAGTLGNYPLAAFDVGPEPFGGDALYIANSGGQVFAIAVDSGLDPHSPWPKAQHDRRNSGNAAGPLP